MTLHERSIIFNTYESDTFAYGNYTQKKVGAKQRLHRHVIPHR